MSVHLVLIDALNLIRRIYAVQERPFLLYKGNSNDLSQSTKDQILYNTLNACSAALAKIVTQLSPTHALAVFDSQQPCWRYELYPDYKKGRNKMPEHLAEKLNALQDEFMTLSIDSIDPDEDEADDIIATLAVKVALRGQKVTIISTDKGFLPLISPNIHVYDHFNRRYLDEAYVKNKFNVKANQLIEFWMLTGDTTNKIPGIPGIGQVTAAELFNKYDSLTAIIAAEDIKVKVKEKLKAGKEQFQLTRKLLTLKQNIPLGFNLKDIRLEQAIVTD